MRLDTEKIKRELKRLGKTQTQMADELGCTRAHINYLLSGKRNPQFETVDWLAAYFNMDPKDLLVN